MPCCKETPVALHVEDLQSSAVGFGFDASWVSDLFSQYGRDILSLVVEAVRGGFSKELVVDVLDKLGPAALELLVTLLNKKKMKASMAGEVVVGEQVGVLDASILEVLVQKYLPLILDKYGDKIVEMLISFLMSKLTK